MQCRMDQLAKLACTTIFSPQAGSVSSGGWRPNSAASAAVALRCWAGRRRSGGPPPPGWRSRCHCSPPRGRGGPAPAARPGWPGRTPPPCCSAAGPVPPYHDRLGGRPGRDWCGGAAVQWHNSSAGPAAAFLRRASRAKQWRLFRYHKSEVRHLPLWQAVYQPFIFGQLLIV